MKELTTKKHKKLLGLMDIFSIHYGGGYMDVYFCQHSWNYTLKISKITLESSNK
jgi:hypothetical protein